MPDIISWFLRICHRAFLPALAVVTCFTGVGGCGKPTQVARETAPAPSIPTALVVESQISGAILGKPLKSPSALATARSGALYLLDSGNKRVIWLDSRFTPIRDYRGQGGISGSFSEPKYLTVDNEQYVWISDAGHRKLVQCSDKLEYVGETDLGGVDAGQNFGHPAGIAVTGFGDIWVADSDNNRIAVFDAQGQIDFIVGDFGYPGGALRRPAKLLLDRHDRIIVCDSDNRRIVTYDDRGGLFSETEHSVFEEPVATVLDSSDQLWVLDKSAGQIHCFDPNGRLLATLGPVVSGTDRPLARPSDIAFTLDGRMVVSDTGNDRVLVCRILTASE